MRKVYTIILNFKVKDLVLKCVESVQKSTYPTKVLVIDNNSEDGLEDEIEKIKEVKFIQIRENLGYTGGNNIGINHAIKNGADFIFILNPDTEIDSNCIKSLVYSADKEDTGIVGPKILFGDEKTIWYAGGILDLDNVLGKHRGVDEKDRGQYNEVIETDFITGAAMFIKREVFEKIGFFDERYFLYYEDADFCFRVNKAGFKVLFVPDAVVYHENAKSAGLGSKLQDYYQTRNRMLFASKFLPLRTRFALFREALRNFGNPMRRKAFLDFLIGNFGKGSYP